MKKFILFKEVWLVCAAGLLGGEVLSTVGWYEAELRPYLLSSVAHFFFLPQLQSLVKA